MKTKLVFIFLTLFCHLVMFAQEFSPRESWPYLYEDFQEGAASTGSGDVVTEGFFNVLLVKGRLMYIGKDGKIMLADMSRVNSARLGSDIFINVGGSMYKLVQASGKCCLLQGKEYDKDQDSKVNIGYGVSSATSTSYEMVILLDGRFNSMSKNIALLESQKFEGRVLPVKETHYFYLDGKLIPATRSSVMSIPGIDRKAANAFIKKEKIRWNKPETLKKLAGWLGEN